MSCTGDIRDFFHYLAGTLVQGGGFNFVLNETADCECQPAIDCDVSAALSDGFGSDGCGVHAVFITRCRDDCWVLVKDEKVITSLSGDIIKFC